MAKGKVKVKQDKSKPKESVGNGSPYGRGRGGPNKQVQLENLEAQLTEEDIKEARKMVADPENHPFIRYAFKLIPKATGSNGLTKKEELYYQELKDIDEKVASQWLEKRLAAKREKAANK